MIYSPAQILEIITAVISVASLIVATTTPEPKGFYGTFYRFLEMLALVTKRAKQNPKRDKGQGGSDGHLMH